jgi:hypothetical protein
VSRAQREKGKRGERQACEVLAELTGVEWERSASQSRRDGGKGRPDLVPCDPDARPGLHPEVKVGKAPPALPALEQACEDARGGAVPFALVRRDRGEWVLVVRVADLDALLGRLRP